MDFFFKFFLFYFKYNELILFFKKKNIKTLLFYLFLTEIMLFNYIKKVDRQFHPNQFHNNKWIIFKRLFCLEKQFFFIIKKKIYYYTIVIHGMLNLLL
jgi:hypothetical protein